MRVLFDIYLQYKLKPRPMANTKKYKEAQVIHVRVEITDIARLDLQALKEGMGTSRTDIVNRAIKYYLKHN